MRAALLLITVLVAASCSSPSAPPTQVTQVPAPTPTSAAPRAAMTVGKLSPALVWFGQPTVFDASTSSGDGLRYHIDFGDGTSADGPTVAHVSQSDQENQKATLTVMDAFGRTDAVTVPVMVVRADTALFWFHESNRRVSLRQAGDSVSGSFSSPAGNLKVIGRVLDDRRIEMESEDGRVRLTGTTEWAQSGKLGSANKVILRLRVSGGPDDGQTFEFRYANPY